MEKPECAENGCVPAVFVPYAGIGIKTALGMGGVTWE